MARPDEESAVARFEPSTHLVSLALDETHKGENGMTTMKNVWPCGNVEELDTEPDGPVLR